MAPQHGGVDAVGRDALHGVRRRLHCDLELVAHGPGRAPQHVRGALVRARGLADPDADPEEVLRVQMRGDGAQAVVPGQAAPGLEAHRAGGQVQLVVHDDDVGRLVDPEPPRQRAHGYARVVHVRRRDGEGHAPAADRGDRGTRLHALLRPQ